MRIVIAVFAFGMAVGGCRSASPPLAAPQPPPASVSATSAEPPQPPPAKTACAAPTLGSAEAWLPDTPQPSAVLRRPKTHAEGGTDCPFYQAAWQEFLLVTQPKKDGSPSFIDYPTMFSLFPKSFVPSANADSTKSVMLLPRGRKGPNQPDNGVVNIDGGIEQAGVDAPLIDQNGHLIYYSIAFNDVIAKFVAGNKLNSPDNIRTAKDDLLFTVGSVELKAAWMRVDEANPPTNYLLARAAIPPLILVDKILKLDPNQPPQEVRVALIALHVVVVIEGHPEFIWATFEHVDERSQRNNAPALASNFSGTSPDTIVDAEKDYILYKKGTSVGADNTPLAPAEIEQSWNPTTQSLGKTTSIYRAFPNSKLSNPDNDEDDEIVAINESIAGQFDSLGSGGKDARRNYRLVGAVWLDKPESFIKNMRFRNGKDASGKPLSTDDPAAIVAGEDGLSSTSMESFTQLNNPNCFSCHDTKTITNVSPEIPAKLINVSHIFSNFIRNNK